MSDKAAQARAEIAARRRSFEQRLEEETGITNTLFVVSIIGALGYNYDLCEEVVRWAKECERVALELCKDDAKLAEGWLRHLVFGFLETKINGTQMTRLLELKGAPAMNGYAQVGLSVVRGTELILRANGLFREVQE